VEVSGLATASDYEYVRLTAGLQHYFRLPWRHVFGVDLFAGMVVGDAPFFEQFYIGDLSALVPDRLLDLSFESRGSPNFLGTVVGEMRYEPLAARAAVEYAVPLHRSERLVYKIDFFTGLGVFVLGELEDFRLARSGYSGLARAPLDLTFDAGFRVDTEIGEFVLSISNLTALVPFRGAPP
jgi:hypothetical protein